MTDPVYERRELIRQVKLPAKQVQRSIQSSLLAYLKTHIMGKCGVEGYLSPDGSTILSHSIGQVVDGGVLYQVKIQVDICYPHKQQTFKAPVVLVSRIGVKLELGPMRILLPRDLHIGNEDFEAVKVGDEVTFQVVGSEFKQDDSVIFVLGQLLKSEQAPSQVEEKKEEEVAIQVPVSSEVKQVMTLPSAEPPKRRKKLLAPRSETIEINPSAE